jgi:hypothetical protein
VSAPQPPGDRDEDPVAADPTAPGEERASGTYDFHGEKLDFDPYRFGAPEPVAPTWGAPTPPGDTTPGRPPEPGERWSPGGSDPYTEVRPGDYWQGGGSQPRSDAVFPPAGYTPPPAGSDPRVDLDKPPVQAPGGYPPPSYQGYAPPGGYPGRPGPSEADRWRGGNKIAAWGFGVGLLGCVLFFTSFFAILIGGTGLGLSIAGYVKGRRGAPNKKMAVWGIVFSLVAIAAGIALLVYAFSQYDIHCIVDLQGDTSRINECAR